MEGKWIERREQSLKVQHFSFDKCENCDDDSTNDCTQDCNGEWGGSAILDNCNKCVGGNTNLAADEGKKRQTQRN